MIVVYSNAGISTKKSWFVKPIPTISVLMFYLLDGRNTKKLKNQKLKCWFFINNNRTLVKKFQKKPKTNIIFHEKLKK